MKTIQTIPVWLFPPTCIFRQTGFAQGPIHSQCSTLTGKAGWDGAVEWSWRCRGGRAICTVPALEPRCNPCTGHSCFFPPWQGSPLPCLLPWDNQVFESGRIPPQAARSLSDRPHCSGKEPAWRKGRTGLPARSCLQAWGYRAPLSNGFWVIMRSPGHAAYWKCNWYRIIQKACWGALKRATGARHLQVFSSCIKHPWGSGVMASHVAKGQLGIGIKQEEKSARTCCARNKLWKTQMWKNPDLFTM